MCKEKYKRRIWNGIFVSILNNVVLKEIFVWKMWYTCDLIIKA